jgi:hypothetical protein
MKPIHLILLCGTYVSLLPFNAVWLADSFGAGMRGPWAGEAVMILGGSYVLVRLYSDAVAGRPANPLLWLFSAVVHLCVFIGLLGLSGSSHFLKQVISSTGAVRDAFHPVRQPYELLPAFAGLAWVFAMFWMPVAAVLSLIAGVAAWRGKRTSDEKTAVGDVS